MTWFAFQGLNGGKAIDLAGIQEKEASAQGFHGYNTEAQAEASPNAINPITQYLADILIADYNAALKEQAQPGGVNASNPAGAVVQSAASSLGLGSVSGLISDLENGNFWLRIGEAALGIVLIAVALAKLSGADNVISKAIPK